MVNYKERVEAEYEAIEKTLTPYLKDLFPNYQN